MFLERLRTVRRRWDLDSNLLRAVGRGPKEQVTRFVISIRCGLQFWTPGIQEHPRIVPTSGQCSQARPEGQRRGEAKAQTGKESNALHTRQESHQDPKVRVNGLAPDARVFLVLVLDTDRQTDRQTIHSDHTRCSVVPQSSRPFLCSPNPHRCNETLCPHTRLLSPTV